MKKAANFFLKKILWHTAEERGNPHAVIDINTGRRAANGINAGQLTGGFFQGRHYFIVMILRIGMPFRVPDHFLAEYRLAILNRRHFPVTGAKVKSDPASIQMTAERLGILSVRRHFVGRCYFNSEGSRINFRHETGIKGPLAFHRVNSLYIPADFGRTADYDPPTSPLPQ